MRTRSRSLSGSLRQKLVRDAWIIMLMLGALSTASGPAQASVPEPGSSPSNPITAIGKSNEVAQTEIFSWSPKGTQKYVTDGPLSTSQFNSIAAAQASALGVSSSMISTSPTTARLQVSPLDDDYGFGLCGVSISKIYKESAHMAADDATISCIGDIYEVGGYLYLTRGSGFLVIGHDSEDEGGVDDPETTAYFHADGSCGTNTTYQYNSAMTEFAIGSVYDVGPLGGVGPYYISC